MMHVHETFEYLERLTQVPSRPETNEDGRLYHVGMAARWEAETRGNPLRWHDLIENLSNTAPVYFADALGELEAWVDTRGDSRTFAWIVAAHLLQSALHSRGIGRSGQDLRRVLRLDRGEWTMGDRWALMACLAWCLTNDWGGTGLGHHDYFEIMVQDQAS